MTCYCCGGYEFKALPNPHPTRSMWSDFSVVERPIGKYECNSCQAVQSHYCCDTNRLIFDGSYALYAHAPGRTEEIARQALYAQWLSPLLQGKRRIFEAGSGNGSLLLALRHAALEEIEVRGVEPASAAAAFAREAGLEVATGFLETSNDHWADVALAVNVIEHTHDPLKFLMDLKSHASETVIVVCPDGSVPCVELLIADHLHSFAPHNMRHLFERAGLTCVAQSSAPAALGGFFVTVGTLAAAVRPLKTGTEREVEVDSLSRCEYLQRWGRLDLALVHRLSHGRPIGCFGAGEAAALLRAYAPIAWSFVSACFTDSPDASEFGSLPLSSLNCAPESLLLGVRPQLQSTVASRLTDFGHLVVRWDDIIPR